MPCYSPNPSSIEIEYARIELLLGELKGKKFNSENYKSAHTWGKDKKELDEITDKLCSTLKEKTPEFIQKQSLELQIWWRDHQAYDLKEKEDQEKEKNLKALALSKLTPEEIALLGIKT